MNISNINCGTRTRGVPWDWVTCANEVSVTRWFVNSVWGIIRKVGEPSRKRLRKRATRKSSSWKQDWPSRTRKDFSIDSEPAWCFPCLIWRVRWLPSGDERWRLIKRFQNTWIPRSPRYIIKVRPFTGFFLPKNLSCSRIVVFWWKATRTWSLFMRKELRMWWLLREPLWRSNRSGWFVGWPRTWRSFMTGMLPGSRLLCGESISCWKRDWTWECFYCRMGRIRILLLEVTLRKIWRTLLRIMRRIL